MVFWVFIRSSKSSCEAGNWKLNYLNSVYLHPCKKIFHPSFLSSPKFLSFLSQTFQTPPPSVIENKPLFAGNGQKHKKDLIFSLRWGYVLFGNTRSPRSRKSTWGTEISQMALVSTVYADCSRLKQRIWSKSFSITNEQFSASFLVQNITSLVFSSRFSSASLLFNKKKYRKTLADHFL